MSVSTSLLAGDIGGTKTLLAIYSCNNNLIQEYKKKYSSYKWESLEDIITDFLLGLPKRLKKPNHGCIAVAGKVSEETTQLTNLSWTINKDRLCKAIKIKNLEIINDFAVLVYGLPFLTSNQIVEIQASKNTNCLEDTFAIIGAGTGLGVARGLKIKNELFALPSEGGHAEFSPRNHDEWELAKWLKKELKTSRLSIERIVSGTGLGHIARWLIITKNLTSHPLNDLARDWNPNKEKNPSQKDLPALASQYAQDGDPTMRKALEMWLSAYGSAVGDLALQELSCGGIWLSGGTASKQINGLRSSAFIDALHNKGRFKPFLKDLPITAIVDPEAGLFSAACRARIIAELNGKLD